LSHKAPIIHDNGLGAMVSDVAGWNESTNEFNHKYGTRFTEKTFTVIQRTAQGIRTQTAQAEGVKIAAGLVASGYAGGEISIPTEGSVILQGNGMQTIALETAEKLTGAEPGTIHVYEASSLRGVAKLGYAEERKRQKAA
jgi:hexokinase